MKKLKIVFVLFLALGISTGVFSQNYTSRASGDWTNASTWTNTSGWGGNTPPVSSGSGTINISHSITRVGDYNNGSTTINLNSGGSLAINGNATTAGTITLNSGSSLTVNGNLNSAGVVDVKAGSTLTINGDFTRGGGGRVDVAGTLIITGSATLNSDLNILPGGKVIIENNITVNSSDYLNVGTSSAPPPYGDLIVYGNLISSGSGDVIVNRNGRVAVFGSISGSSSGGTILTVNNGGQVYVHGNIGFVGGGDAIRNNNSTNPYGLYVNGTITNSGGGASTTGNTGNQATMQNTNPPFYNWVSTLPNSPMPVTWLSFSVRSSDNKSAYLAWATASELNAESFFIERSSNGKEYETVGSIPAAGTTKLRQDYSFTDTQPRTGRNYYRLRQVDFDGTFSYSDIRFVDLTGSRTASVYPNPLENSHWSIQLNFSGEDEIFGSVIDVSGTVVHQFRFNGNTFSGPIHLNAGTYILKLRAGTDTLVSRFVVK